MTTKLEDDVAYDLGDQFGGTKTQEYKFYNGRFTLYYDDGPHVYYRYDNEGKKVIVPNATTVLGIVDKSFVLINWAVRECINSLEESLELVEANSRRELNFSSKEFTRTYLVTALETARKAHRDKKNKAADIGKLAHNWLEAYGRLRMGGSNHERASLSVARPADLKAINCINAALKWIEEHNVVPIHVERKVYSESEDSCGTTDWIGMVDGKLSIIDWKSSNYVYDEHRLQLAFYKKAFEEETGRKLEQRILLRLGKEYGEFDPHVFSDPDECVKDEIGYMAALVLYNRIQQLKEQKKIEAKEAKLKKKAA